MLGLGLVLPATASAAAPDATGRLLVTAEARRDGVPSGRRARGGRAPRAPAAQRPRRPADPPRHRAARAPGESLRALARRLRADPRVAARRSPSAARASRFKPNDPALSAAEPARDTAPGTTVEWWAARSGFLAGVGHQPGARARPSRSSTPASTTPSRARRARRATSRPSTPPGTARAAIDEVGHGTHVASLACAAADNGVGLAGAGLGCRLLIVKSDLSDSSVAGAIVWATDRGADAINMSFGTDGPRRRRAPSSTRIDYAYEHGVVLVAAAADDPSRSRATRPTSCSRRAPAPDLDAGQGPVGHRRGLQRPRAPLRRARHADLASPPTAPTERRGSGPPGLFGAFPRRRRRARARHARPAGAPVPLPHDLRGRRPLRLPAGHVDGRADGRRRRRAVRHLNPDLPAPRDRPPPQADRPPPGRARAGRPTSAGGSSTRAPRSRRAATIDRRAAGLEVRRLPGRTHAHARSRCAGAGGDSRAPGVVESGVAALRDLALDRRPHGARELAEHAASARAASRSRRGHRYGFFTIGRRQGGQPRGAAARRPTSR